MEVGTSTEKNNRLRLLELQQMQIQARKRRLELEASQQAEADATPVETHLQAQERAFIEAYPLEQFVEEGFQELEQGRLFRGNWHISIICLVLQATLTLAMRNVIINIPRRTMKSLLNCVLFPAYVWTFLPQTRFLYTSYSAEFAGRDNKKTLELIDSDWYQRNFGHIFKIRQRQEKKKISNDKGGFRVVFKIGKGTGEGGDYVFADDPNSIDEVESEKILEKTNNGWNEISAHNVTDRATARRVIIQQRTTSDDLTGNITEDDKLKNLYQVLCLAMKYESDNPLANTPERPIRLGFVTDNEANLNPALVAGEEKLWIDPRDIHAPNYPNKWYQDWYKRNFTDKGLVSKGELQLLWENYLTEEIIAHDVAHLKAHGEHAQFQQRPVRRGGNFFNSLCFPEIKLQDLPKTGLIFTRIWDKAGTDGAGDFTVGMLMARSRARPHIFYVVEMWTGQVSYHERMEKMKELAKSDYDTYIAPYEEDDDYNEYFITIEKEGNSSGSDISIIEKEELGGDYEVRFVNPRKKKAVRAKPAKLISEQGRIKVVKGFWNGRFYNRLEKFDPNKDRQKDDEIDTLAHGVNILRGAATSSDSGASAGVI